VGGFPAARLTDPTVHGGMIVMGCPTVMINDLPAARIGDTHVCPMVTVLVPHVGGPLVLGSFTVIVGGMPQSRVTDMLICVGPPDTVINGSTNVMVGMAGAAGALGVLKGLAMGGLATLKRWAGGGYPRAVRQPDGSIITQYNSTISIEGSPSFQSKVLRDLNKMSQYPKGRERIKSIEKAGQPVRIKYGASNETTPDAGHDADAAAKGKPAWTGGVGTGKGTGSTVAYDPDREPPTAADPTIRRPADVALHHELTHADHMAHGAEDASPDPAHPNNPNLEETRVIDEDNQYRDQRGIPRRADHTVL
jgi:uncharacterized Zn-binding protein involved in type VI secretion